MLEITRLQKRDGLVLILILCVAALLRFGQAGIAEFFHDDAMVASMVQDMVTGGGIPLTGINSSVGIPNPPTSIYALALPFALDLNPMTTIYFIMGWNVVGVGLLWFIAHRYFGRTVALVAGLTYAVSPWAVLYSRKIWAQDYHTPFVLLGLLLALYGFWEANRRADHPKRAGWLSAHEWAQVWSLPVLLFGFQIHFASWALMPVFGLIALIGWRRVSWRAVMLSALLSVFVMTPYAIGLSQTLERDPNRITDAIDRSDATSGLQVTLQPLAHIAYLTTGYGMETWVAQNQEAQMLQQVPPSGLWWLIGALGILGIAALHREKLRWFAPVLLVWAFLPALALVPKWTDVYVHYFIASIPALGLLIGLGTAWLTHLVPAQPYGRTIILVAFAGLLLSQAIWWRGALRYLDETQIAYPGFTIPIHYLHDVEEHLDDYDDVLVLSDGMAWDLHHESVVWPVMLRDTAACVRTLIGDGYAVFPAGAFAVLQAPNMPADGIGNLYLTDAPQVVRGRSDQEVYAVHHWDQAPSWNGAAITPIDPVRYEGDVRLTGYHLNDNQVLLEWQLPAAIPGRDYQYSAQFMSAAGEKIGQADQSFWQGRHWCAGDRLLTWQPIALPEDTAALHVIMYQLGDATTAPYVNASTLDADGNPTGERAIIDLR